jgi:hypothetical protein
VVIADEYRFDFTLDLEWKEEQGSKFAVKHVDGSVWNVN